jgi:hypothetical protein
MHGGNGNGKQLPAEQPKIARPKTAWGGSNEATSTKMGTTKFVRRWASLRSTHSTSIVAQACEDVQVASSVKVQPTT